MFYFLFKYQVSVTSFLALMDQISIFSFADLSDLSVRKAHHITNIRYPSIRLLARVTQIETTGPRGSISDL